MPRNTSNFALAAKILFDSAQKVGAVGKVSHNSGKKFQCLNNVNKKSKPKAVLNSVSVKVANFLEARRAQSLNNDSLKLPEFAQRKKVQEFSSSLPSLQKATLNGRAETTKITTAQSHLNLSIPSFTGTHNLLVPQCASHNVNVRPIDPSERSSTLQNKSYEPPKLVPDPVINESAKSFNSLSDNVLLETDLITEDKPIFEYQELKQQHPHSQVELASRALPSKESRQAKGLSDAAVGCLVDHTETLRNSSELNQRETESITVDSWEQQREKELERLDAIRKAEDEKLALLHLEEQHKTLGLEWVKKRSRVIIPHETAVALDLKEVNQLRGEERFKKLELMITTGCSETTIAAAVAIILRDLSKGGLIERMEGKSRLLDILEAKKELSSTFQRVKLYTSSKEEFLDIYRSLEKSSQESLDFRIKKKAVKYLATSGSWEDALQLVNFPRCSTSQKRSLLVTLLYSSLRLEWDVKASIISAVRSSEHVGKEAKLLLELLEKGSSRRIILKQSVSSPETDERTYSALIACSSEKDIPDILADMEKKGYNTEDLCVKRVLLMKKFREDSISRVFEEIEKQKQTIGLRPFHLSAAIKAMKKDDSSNTLDMISTLLKEFSPERSFWALKKMLPKLYDRGMFKEIVSLSDHYGLSLPLEKVLPFGIAFINEALINVSRSPINSLRTSDINYTRSPPEDQSAQGTTAKTDFDVSATTEMMLSLARERQWEKALNAIQNLPPVNNENSAALTLLFNCALSAAVEKCEVTREIYTMMKSKNVVPNTTTVNTALSSLSKASLTEEALSFVKGIPLSAKDVNTYMILLSLLAKNNMYEEVMATFDEAKNIGSKLPTSLFAVVLSVTVNHSWENSLKVFQELIKMHGKNASEALKVQVLKCLEKNGRHTEMSKLMKSLDTKRKKR